MEGGTTLITETVKSTDLSWARVISLFSYFIPMTNKVKQFAFCHK